MAGSSSLKRGTWSFSCLLALRELIESTQSLHVSWPSGEVLRLIFPLSEGKRTFLFNFQELRAQAMSTLVALLPLQHHFGSLRTFNPALPELKVKEADDIMVCLLP